jgi:hypothetical protein
LTKPPPSTGFLGGGTPKNINLLALFLSTKRAKSVTDSKWLCFIIRSAFTTIYFFLVFIPGITQTRLPAALKAEGAAGGGRP